MTFTQEERDNIIRILQERHAVNACEVCGNNNFSVADTAVQLTIRDLHGPVVIPSPSIPAAAVVCSNCGNIRLHALGALGLLQRNENNG